ncbi:unnamed protein product [Oikopleura dioica]|uniref:Uncharacterized protein n=1 Tax=Oikopleura dioica TaxID=34765 RepID=E4Y219_OIKDI|nr:unnamed protein product [Oikopleura dioica]
MFGSEALHGSAHFFWIPLVAPLVGGVIGALCYLFVISAHWPEEEKKIEEEYQKVSDGEIISDENINVEMIRTTSEIQRQEFY